MGPATREGERSVYPKFSYVGTVPDEASDGRRALSVAKDRSHAEAPKGSVLPNRKAVSDKVGKTPMQMMCVRVNRTRPDEGVDLTLCTRCSEWMMIGRIGVTRTTWV